MITRFLKARHWQLFVLVFGIPLIFQLVILGLFTASSFGESSLMSEVLLSLIVIAPAWMLSLLLAWFYAVGVGLQTIVSTDLHRSTSLFKVALIFPVVYILLIVAVVFPLLSVMATSMMGGNFILIVIFTLHLFAMFCIFYSMYFVARGVKEAELQNQASFSDFAGEFFLIWFFPVGVWILQPRINELVKAEGTNSTSREYV